MSPALAPLLADRAAARALALLSAAGHRALIVGGAVRDALLGRTVGDIDIATDALPAQVLALAAEAGLKALPTGIAHGTVTLILAGRPVEVTTFRRDVATDGRRAVVAFSDRIEDDAARRDFTLNALYLAASGEVLDPVGGLPDLEARRLRFVGDPARRIAEDALRILRLYRFLATLGPGAGADPAALAACAAAAADVDTLSRERVGAEMLRLLAAPDPAPALRLMAEAGVLARVLPGADPAALPPLIAAETREGIAPAALRRLAAVGGDASGLRLSRAQQTQLARLSARDAPAALAYRHGAAMGEDAALLAAAQGGALREGWRAAIALAAASPLPIAAADLPGLTGPALGRALKEAETAWLASAFTAPRAALLAAARGEA